MSPEGAAALAATLPLPEPGRVKEHVPEHLFVRDDAGARVGPPWPPGTLVFSSFDMDDSRRPDDPVCLGLIVCVEGDVYHVLWSEETL